MAFGIFQFRRGTVAQWSSSNPVLRDGELGLETDTRQFKIGNGSSPWSALEYGGIVGPKGDIGDLGPRGFDGWEPVLATVADGDRCVLRLADWTGGEGTKPTAFVGQYIGPTGYTTNIAQATDIRGPVGIQGPPVPLSDGEPSALGAPDPGQSLEASRADHRHRLPTAAQVGADPAGSATSKVQDHEQATDPHPQYLTQGEGDARYAQPSQIPAAGTDNAGMTRTTPTTSASTAVTVLQSFPLPVGSVQAGSEFEFSASLRVINTTTATNSVVTLSVGAVNVLVLTQANGTTAAAAPGAPVFIEGRITFTSTTTAEAVIGARKSQAVAFNAVTNTSAPVAVVTAEATSLDLKFNTSGTTATFICRQATIQRVK